MNNNIIHTVEVPILEQKTLPNGQVRIKTNWVIKGKITERIRTDVGSLSIEDLMKVPINSDSNIIYTGISETRFTKAGITLFNRLINVYD